MKVRLAALAGVVVLGAIAVIVVAWPSDPDRTDQVLEVYAQQLGLTEAEAREQQEEALDIADFYCSIEPENLVAVMDRSTSPVEDAIRYAEAACPDTAQEFEAVLHEAGPDESKESFRADLVVGLDAGLAVTEIRDLGFVILRIPGVEDVHGDSTTMWIQLSATADRDRVISEVHALAGVADVQRA